MPGPLRPNWPIALQWQPLEGQPPQFGVAGRLTANGSLQINLARLPAVARETRFKLSAPIVLAPAPVASGPLGFLAAQPPRPRTHYRLSPPAVVNPASQPSVETTMRRTLAEPPPRHRRSTFRLGGPLVVQPATTPPVETTMRVTLAQWPHGTRRNGWGLAPPAIVDLPPAEAKIRVTLAEQKRWERTRYRLAPPTILGTVAPPTFLPRKSLVTLYRVNGTHPLLNRPSNFRLGAPTVVNPAVVPLSEQQLRPRNIRAVRQIPVRF